MDGSAVYSQGLAVLDHRAVSDMVGRLNLAGLTAGGGVAVLNLEPVRSGMAERWEVKRDNVYEHAERTLRRDLGPDAIIARASDVDILVAQPGVESLLALTRALQGLRDVLRYFIGEVRHEDLNLSHVESMDGGQLGYRRVDPRTLTAAPPAPKSAPSAPQLENAGVEFATHTDFLAEDGVRIRVTCGHDDLFVLKSGAQVGSRLRPCLTDISGPNRLSIRLNALEWKDAESVDHAVLRQAAAHFPVGAGPVFVVAPVAFSTLSCQRSRRIVLNELLALSGRLGRRPVIEIRDLRGVPSGRLAEIVSLVRPSTGGVLGEVEADKASIVGAAGSGLNGVVIRSLADWQEDPRLTKHFSDLADLARSVAPLVIGRAASVMRLPAMAAAGFTHAFVPPVYASPMMGPTGACVLSL